jgi:hypothetical protein
MKPPFDTRQKHSFYTIFVGRRQNRPSGAGFNAKAQPYTAKTALTAETSTSHYAPMGDHETSGHPGMQ